MMKLTIILRAEVESTEEAQQKVNRVREALASFPEVELSAQVNTKLEPTEEPS